MINLSYQKMYYGPNTFCSEQVVLIEFKTSIDILKNAEENIDLMKEYFPSRFNFTSQSKENPELFLAEYLSYWSLNVMNQSGAFLHASGAKIVQNKIIIYLGYYNAKFSLLTLQHAANIFIEIYKNKTLSNKTMKIYELFKTDLYNNNRSDFQAKILMTGARANDIPYLKFYDNSKMMQYGWGKNSLVFIESSPIEDLRKPFSEKVTQKSLFHSLGFPTAPFVIAKSEKELTDAMSKLSWPLIAKPIDSGKSKGVTTLIETPLELKAAFYHALKYSKRKTVLIEKYIPGEVHRLTVLNGKLISANLRARPFILGNGKKKISQLIDEYNETRKNNSLGTVPKDKELEILLSKQNIENNQVLEKGRKVILRRISFQDSGSMVSDVTDLVHPDVKKMVESISSTLNMYIVGFDFISEDISQSFRKNGVLLEANQVPFIPSLIKRYGSEAEVGKLILGERPSRIPIVLLLVKNKSIINNFSTIPLAKNTAFVSSQNMKIGTMELLVTNVEVLNNIRSILKNRTVESLIIAITKEELMSKGMPIDKVDKSILCLDEIGKSWKNVLKKHSKSFKEYPVNKSQEVIKDILKGLIV